MDSNRNDDLIAHLAKSRETGVLAVACPTCGSEAGFHRPFAWFTGEAAVRAKADPQILGISESRGYIVELYPEVFLWTDPDRPQPGSTDRRVGVVRCANCKQHSKHRIAWPADLYYRLRVNGHELIAYTREHAEDNLTLLLGLQSLPPELRPFLREEVEARMPETFLEEAFLEPTIEALSRLLFPPTEPD